MTGRQYCRWGFAPRPSALRLVRVNDHL